jgi:hypothetical protein
MLVASDLGASSILWRGAIPRKRRNFKAVSRSVPGSDIEFKQPEQLPTFNLSKKIRKPFIVEEPPKFKGVPLKSLQQFSHAEGASLFDAPMLLIPEPLNVVVPSTAKIDWDAITAELEVPFQPGFQYDKGIRPGVRNLKPDTVDEPAFAFPTRPSLPVAPSKVQTGTFRVGNKDYNVLGY